jgi:subtilisin family serine protease/subtilase family serine protease
MQRVAAAATLALLAGGSALAGSPFGPAGTDTTIDLSVMGAKFPKKDKQTKEGEVLVRFKSTVPQSTRDALHVQLGNQKLRELRGTGVHHVRVSPDQTIDQAVARYAAESTVQYAEPNFSLMAMRVPSEPAFNLLWGLNNTGQTLGTPGADIKATLAWDLVVGSPTVAVMVIDSGVDYNHQDLAGNIWVNPGEVAGNGIDDDGNGYIDDVRGIDVINVDVDPMDDYGHGTHVAGTVGAVGNNALGVVGVNWAVRLIPCKFLDATGNGSVADAVTCLDYARSLKAAGVNIVATVNSYGGLGAFSQTMFDAINAQRDILFVAAAGNFGLDNDSNDFFPANIALPNVLSVAATDHTDQMPTFSDFGRRSVHLGAPGANITSTTPFNNYLAANGTSMAAPHVAGVAALLKSQDGTRDWRAIKNLILAGTDPKPALNGKTITGGRLDASASASCANRPKLSALKLPQAFTLGVPVTLSVLSVNCANAVGPVTATVSPGGQTFTLVDDGIAPDIAAGDGIFTATWTPTQAFSSITFSSAAGTETVGMLDLTPTAVSGPVTATRGDAITVNVTLSNPSSMSAPASTLNVYLSVDGVITATDILLGSVATPALAAGAQAVVPATVAIPANVTAATYFLGAIVDPGNQIDEADETNNTRAGSTIAVGAVANDLTISALSGPATGITGDPIAVSATVNNLGSTAAPASTLNFYLSTDQVITTADRFIGTAAIGSLAAGGSQLVSGSVPVPVDLAPGTYYLGAIIDPDNVVAETNETNNTRVGNTIATSTRNIDLSLTAVGGPTTAKDQAAITLTATVKNGGTVTAPASTVRWYLSTDPTITTADYLIASAATGSLAGGKTQRLSVTASVPGTVPAGTYYLGAIVDPNNTLAETNNANNALQSGTVAVSYSVDLLMTAVAGPTAAATGQSVTVTGTVMNQGLVKTAGNVTVGFYASADAAITTGDTLLGTVTVAPIAAGASVPVSLTAVLNTALKAGTYTVGAIADPGALVAESVESNNARAGNTVAVTYGPDLIVTAVSGPASAARGASVTLNGTVRNQGVGALGALSDQNVGATASTVRLGFYLSTNNTITANDTLVGAVAIGPLSAGQSVPLSVTITLPTSLKAGTYYLGAIADFSNGIAETNEVNNALVGATLVVN